MSINECSKITKFYAGTPNNQKSFFNFVYNKIARDTKNRFVEKQEDSIDILPFNNHSIKVIPMWKELDRKNINIDEEIKLSCQAIQNTDIKCVYFVYPKSDTFNKHIQVKVPVLEEACEEYLIKLIPYSLKNRFNKKGYINGNSSFLCK